MTNGELRRSKRLVVSPASPFVFYFVVCTFTSVVCR